MCFFHKGLIGPSQFVKVALVESEPRLVTLLSRLEQLWVLLHCLKYLVDLIVNFSLGFLVVGPLQGKAIQLFIHVNLFIRCKKEETSAFNTGSCSGGTA
jgi:hypothetical protein